MPYRERTPTIPESPAPPPRAVDDPERVRLEEQAENNRLVGRLLVQVDELQTELARVDRVQKSLPPPPPPPAPVERQPETFRGVTLTQAKIGLMMAITGILTLVTPFVAWKVTTAQGNTERTEVKSTQAANVAESAKTEAKTNGQAIEELWTEIRRERAQTREVFRQNGVIYPKVEGDPAPPAFKRTVPLRKPGVVSPGPVLILEPEQQP